MVDARPAERVCTRARSLARPPDRGGGITYEEGVERGWLLRVFLSRERDGESEYCWGGREREERRESWEERGREIMEEKECVNQPVSGGEKSWGGGRGEEREGGKRERNRAQGEGEGERKRGGGEFGVELSANEGTEAGGRG